MLKHSLKLLLIMCSVSLFAQDYFPSNSGVATKNTNYTAFTNATIYVSPTEVINNGTLLIKEGKVVSVGKSVSIPKNTTVIDASEKTIYPSFIDIYTSFGIKTPERARGSVPQYEAGRSGFYWNDHIRPEQDALTTFEYDEKSASELHKLGFGVVNTHMPDGIVRGTGALVALNNNADNAVRVIDGETSQHLSFEKSVQSRQVYPSSIMGSMALLRQMYDDAKWYAEGKIETRDLALEALNDNKNLLQIFEAGSRANLMRADKVGDAVNIQYTIVGGGDEYERIDDIKKTNATLILPLDFQLAYDVEDPFLASKLSLSDMRSWNQEPHNPRLLAENGVNFTLTTHGLKKKSAFTTNLMKAIESGLSKEKALEALTTTPAQLLSKSNEIGSLKVGSYANFLITSGDIFDKNTTLYHNWVQGTPHVLNNMNVKNIDGDYNFKLAGNDYKLSISGSTKKPKAELISGDKKLGTKMSYTDDWVNLTFKTADSTKNEYIRVVANAANGSSLNGKAILPNGTELSLFASKSSTDGSEVSDKKKSDKKKDELYMSPITYPNMAYGYSEKPRQETLLFKNATIWTNESDGVLENTDILIKDGKITEIGQNLSNRSAKVIDATGKHITAGIIDEHSHIGAASINEGGQNSSAEVTIEDVLDDEDIDIYRNLAGGVTSIQILHGSANPIGGRSAVIKLKWGESADDYIYDNSPKFIKFALGENVKQSRSRVNMRFPQSRMGVEQVFMDYFSRAKAYDDAKKSGKPYRKDTEMEVIAEILNGERFISCHSYVQSEINMLMKVAEKFNFKINTFTHILEGYKVADKMAEHGVGGSTFSDWWAYKYEVNDAIPYNAAIMHNAGVVTAINSDDAEMSRRLNQEAAKSIKYGGVSEEDALKFVTLNPAKLLHLDERVGSLKIGKDADVVLWSDHPLSIYAKAEKTIIEGKTYFDLEKDTQMRKAIAKEKSELINLMLQDKNKGLKTQPIKKKEKVLLHCDSMDSGY